MSTGKPGYTELAEFVRVVAGQIIGRRETDLDAAREVRTRAEKLYRRTLLPSSEGDERDRIIELLYSHFIEGASTINFGALLALPDEQIVTLGEAVLAMRKP